MVDANIATIGYPHALIQLVRGDIRKTTLEQGGGRVFWYAEGARCKNPVVEYY
jgi:hypothetical protein